MSKLPGDLESFLRDPTSNGILLVLRNGETIYRSEAWLAEVAVATYSQLVEGNGTNADARRWLLMKEVLTEEELDGVEAAVGFARKMVDDVAKSGASHLRFGGGLVKCRTSGADFVVPELRHEDAFDCPACGSYVPARDVLS